MDENYEKAVQELIDWLAAYKITWKRTDEDVFELPPLGKYYFQDNSCINSIYRSDEDGNLAFNLLTDRRSLMLEGIRGVLYKFGACFYYHDFDVPFTLEPLEDIGTRLPLKEDFQYVNLGVHTGFELLNGSALPETWVKKAAYMGHKALGVCDYNTMGGLFQLQKACQSRGMTPVLGYSFTIADGEWKVDAKVYVQGQEGLHSLLGLQKAIMVDSPDNTVDIKTLCSLSRGLVLVFGKLSAAYLDAQDPETGEYLCALLLETFERSYFQIDPSEYKADRIDRVVLENLKTYYDGAYESVPPVLICDCYYTTRDKAQNKIVLNKIDKKAAHRQSDDQYFKDTDELWEEFRPLFDESRDVRGLFKEACDATLEIAAGATAAFDTSRNHMPQYDMTKEEKEKYGNTRHMFAALIEEGLERLVPEADRERYRKQAEFEKYIIESTENVDYLLVQYDTVNWCRRNGIMVGCGRGSAAGSLLLYLLGVTLVDPLRYGLIFERFLIPERAGFMPSDVTTIEGNIQGDSSDFYEVTLEDMTLRILPGSTLYVRRGQEENPIEIPVSELQENDDIIFDNRDKVFTLKEIQQCANNL